jgi:hypothetical protein
MGVEIHIHKGDLQMLNREMNRLAEQTGKTLKEVLIPQARLFCADLAFWTRPMGKGSGDNKENMEKVHIRIQQVYPPVGRIVNLLKSKNEGVAGKFAGLITARQYAKAKAITDRYLPDLNLAIGAFDGGQLHRAQSEQKKVTRRLLVPGYTRVTAYANQTARKVGFAKGGFATAARQLGGVRGIPGFATRQKAPGKGTVTGDGKTLTVTIENHVKYLQKAFVQGGEDYAESYREKQVTSLLKRIQDRKVKAAMRHFQ